MASKRSLATSVLALVSGCALTINGPDPDRPRNEIPHCDTGKGSVGLDAVASGMFGLAAIAAFSDGEEAAGLSLAAVGGLFVASAVRGNTAANQCRAAYAEYNVAYQQMLRQPPRPVEQPPRPVEPRPRPTVARKPAVVEPPPPPEPAPTEVDEPEPQPPVPQVPRPEAYGSPRPAPKKPAAEPADTEDDWSAFWKEAP